MRWIVCVAFALCMMSAQAQKIEAKDNVNDSTVYYFATLKLNSGLYVVTPIDTLKAKADQVKNKLIEINELNKPRLLKYSMQELGDKDLTAEIGSNVNILEIQPTVPLLRSELDKFISMNDGKVYNLLRFKFAKPRVRERINVRKYD